MNTYYNQTLNPNIKLPRINRGLLGNFFNQTRKRDTLNDKTFKKSYCAISIILNHSFSRMRVQLNHAKVSPSNTRAFKKRSH